MDREQPTTGDPTSSRRRWVVPVAFAVLVAIEVGVVVSIAVFGGDSGGDNVAPTAASPTTTIGEAEPVSFVPGLGTLTWAELDAPRADLQDTWNPITFDAEYGYRWFHGPGVGVWSSAEGLEWTFRYMPPSFGDFRIGSLRDNGLGVGASADGRYVVVEWTDDGWAEIADLSPITDTAGIVWNPNLGWLRRVGDVVYSDARLDSELPWGETFGTFQRVATCRSKNCERSGPKATWDEAGQVLRLVHPFNGRPIASLKISIDGDTATFVDVETHHIVHEVVGTSGLPIEHVVGAIKRETPTPRRFIRLDGSLVSTAGESFVFSSPPWKVEPPRFTVPIVFAAPDGSGFVAYEQNSGMTGDPDGRWSVIGGRTWTSEDALNWTEAAAQPFLYPWPGRLTFRARPGAIVAEVAPTDGDGIDHIRQLWESHDGVAWTQRPVHPDSSVLSPGLDWAWMGTEFGYVRYQLVRADTEDGPSRWRYWVLADGDTWVEVVAPPGQPTPLGGDALAYGWNQAAGSLMYWGKGDRSTAALWVGRFDS